MDFGSVLHTAAKNDKNKNEPIRYYSTKFEPPKKVQRDKKPSVNVQRFLAKKEAEAKQKALEDQQKMETLLSLRSKDKKAVRRVNVMLKMTKSANQSAIEDAVDKDNTSVTLAGCTAQPDEDDYGYVSQESAALYAKMMERYSKMPVEPRFTLDKKKKVSTNLSSTKDRVRAALEREKEEANMPHKRKRKHQEEGTAGRERDEQEETAKADMPPPKAKPRPAAPPPMAFADLLKLAEKKQFEPIVIEKKPKEEEKLLTKKQKKEYEREKEWRDRKEGRLPPLDVSKLPPTINKKGAAPATSSAQPRLESKVPSKVPMGNLSQKNNNNNNNSIASDNNSKKSYNGVPPPKAAATSTRPPSQSSNSNGQRRPEMVAKRKEDAVSSASKQKQAPLDSRRTPPIKSSQKQLPSKQFPPRDVQRNGDPKRSKQLDGRAPPSGPPKRFPPADVRGPSKQFPPPDVRMARPKDVQRKPAAKRRILYDDDDEEYDSEMDDFIDDGPDDEVDISEAIKNIFKYDKSRYRDANDDDVDNMESSFAEVAREESISSKIGKWEDEQDMKLEAEEKKRKALMKKKMLKRM